MFFSNCVCIGVFLNLGMFMYVCPLWHVVFNYHEMSIVSLTLASYDLASIHDLVNPVYDFINVANYLTQISGATSSTIIMRHCIFTLSFTANSFILQNKISGLVDLVKLKLNPLTCHWEAFHADAIAYWSISHMF